MSSHPVELVYELLTSIVVPYMPEPEDVQEHVHVVSALRKHLIILGTDLKIVISSRSKQY